MQIMINAFFMFMIGMSLPAIYYLDEDNIPEEYRARSLGENVHLRNLAGFAIKKFENDIT